MVPNQKTTALDSFVDQSAPICYGILKPGEHVSDGIPVIKVKNIIGGRIIEGDLLRTSPKIHNQYKRAEVKQGDLLLTIRGTTGRVAIVPSSLAGANITQDTARIRVSSDDEPMYVFYALQSPDVQRQIDLNTVGQAVKGINIAEVRKLRIFHPIGIEQKKIAKILSTWDKAITTTEQLLANSQQQKKSLMQQLLTGKKRLLDNNEVRFVGEWKYVVLGCVFEKISNGVTYDAKSLSGLPVTRIETISTGEIDFKKVGWAPDSENTKRFKLEIGDILYSHINSLEHIGRVAYFNDNRSLYHGMNLLLLRTKKQNNSLFFYHLLNSQVGKKYAKLYAKSAVNQASISTTDIKAFKVYIPESEEQQKIATVLSTADQEITTLQQKLDALKQEKKALMQQLLTGKRRVKVEEAA
ncbi:restriction endonuclease subunit S [Aeromonas dhakensis]|uniref:restriction endonuclease subunit S n=1 Tax=Aeromonas dhakensis TaxID=196024 RepID=UPI003986B431